MPFLIVGWCEDLPGTIGHFELFEIFTLGLGLEARFDGEFAKGVAEFCKQVDAFKAQAQEAVRKANLLHMKVQADSKGYAEALQRAKSIPRV